MFEVFWFLPVLAVAVAYAFPQSVVVVKACAPPAGCAGKRC